MTNSNNYGGFRQGAGRHKLPDDVIRKNHTMKFTDEEWQLLEGLAIKNGCVTKIGKPNIGKYMRQLALKSK